MLSNTLFVVTMQADACQHRVADALKFFVDGTTATTYTKGNVEIPIVGRDIDPKTESVGTGLGGGLVYMHPASGEETDAPTTMTGAIGMYTDSKRWAAGGFHDGYYLDDRIRFRVPAVHGELETNGEANIVLPPVDVETAGGVFKAEGRFRPAYAGVHPESL